MRKPQAGDFPVEWDDHSNKEDSRRYWHKVRRAARLEDAKDDESVICRPPSPKKKKEKKKCRWNPKKREYVSSENHEYQKTRWLPGTKNRIPKSYIGVVCLNNADPLRVNLAGKIASQRFATEEEAQAWAEYHEPKFVRRWTVLSFCRNIPKSTIYILYSSEEPE